MSIGGLTKKQQQGFIMSSTTKLFLLGPFLTLTLILNSGNQVFANDGVQSGQTSCCDQLLERVKFLEDKAVISDTKKIKLSGHVNRAALWLDDQVHSNLAHVDNDNSSSRINLTGTAGLNEDMTVGGTFEVEMKSNSNDINDVHEAQSNQNASKDIRIRKAELFFTSKSFGQLNMGRGRMASDGAMEDTDLSGTTVVALGASGPFELAGGARFTNKATNAKFTSARVSGIFDSADGLSRRDRIMYSTPTFYGFSIHTSHGYQDTGDLIDIAAKFAGKLMGTKIAAQIAIAKDQSSAGSEFELINGSIGALFPLSFSGKEDTGVNIFFATAHKNWDAVGRDDGHVYFGKIGLLDRFFTIGNTAVAVDLGTFHNMILDPTVGVDDRGKTWGLSFVQNLDVVATELYAGYRNYKFKRKHTTDRFNHIDAVMVGARVKI